MNRLPLIIGWLAVIVVIFTTFAMLNRNYARALEQCERYHSRATCIHMMR